MTEEAEIMQPTPRAAGPDFLTQTKFADLDLPPQVLAGLDEVGFVHCTPIQAEVIPMALTGKDVAGQAQTGTGKTAAFLVVTFTRLLARPEKKAGCPSALIVAPTRELALQIYEDAGRLGRHTGLTQSLAIGGIDYKEQAEAIRGGPDLVICTPGRIIDYLQQGIFKTSKIEILVIDEADRLFDLGFIKDLRYLIKKLPHFEKRQSMLFSATLSYRILELTYDCMNLPEFISATPDHLTVSQVEQSLYHVGRDEKLRLLLGLLAREDWTRVLIFVNTKAGVEWVARKLQGNGLPAEAITGDLPQRRRLKLMEEFKDGQIKILVATDVASRGIHVEDISHVFNYDLPQDVENYVHRIGRTARAGKAGKAISFACEDYVFHLEPLEQMLGYKLPVVWPEDGWFKEDKAGRVYLEPRERPERTRAGRGRDRDRRRAEAPRPREARPEARAKKPEALPRRWRGILMIARPGGIFGLSPRSRPPSPVQVSTETPPPPLAPAALRAQSQDLEPELDLAEETQADEPKKKKRRRRRKKKGPADIPSVEARESPAGGMTDEGEDQPAAAGTIWEEPGPLGDDVDREGLMDEAAPVTPDNPAPEASFWLEFDATPPLPQLKEESAAALEVKTSRDLKEPAGLSAPTEKDDSERTAEEKNGDSTDGRA
ncbi:MAG: DEAD/DEAH box helicase [Thermodesulfobacteriota bacterium]